MPASSGTQQLKQVERIGDGRERQGLALVDVGVPEAQLAVPEPVEGEEPQREEVAGRGPGSRGSARRGLPGEGQEGHQRHESGRGPGSRPVRRPARLRSWQRPDRPGRNARHQVARGHVLRHHAARGHEGLRVRW